MKTSSFKFKDKSGHFCFCNCRCYNAKGPLCKCICNGLNHGIGSYAASENLDFVIESVENLTGFIYINRHFQLPLKFDSII